MFALVDCNNFYASCERVFNPALRNKPLAILSNNDGCVISRSDEAKALGLPMGAPAFKYEGFFKSQGITVLSSNYPLYGDMSTRVLNILGQFTPNVEAYSIDEAFLEFKGYELFDFNTIGKEIRSRVLKWTGIPTCVGIAPTKALSKVANKIARKFPEDTGGVYIMDSEEKRLKAVKWIPLANTWGIGHRLQKRLSARGCKTAYDFTQLSDQWVLKNFSITEWKLKKDLEGVSKINLDERQTKKAIATTRSFEYTYSDIGNLKERISTFAGSCAEKLRKQGSSCHMMIIQLSSDRHKKGSPQHRESKTVVFPYPTDSTLLLSNAAMNAVSDIYRQGIKYKRAGVIVTGLVPTENHQLDFFAQENPKHKPLMRAMDYLNERFKSDKVKLASQDLERTWKMRQERLSPKYTTNINDIIKIR